jgi:hypothetical protein
VSARTQGTTPASLATNAAADHAATVPFPARSRRPSHRPDNSSRRTSPSSPSSHPLAPVVTAHLRTLLTRSAAHALTCSPLPSLPLHHSLASTRELVKLRLVYDPNCTTSARPGAALTHSTRQQ